MSDDWGPWEAMSMNPSRVVPMDETTPKTSQHPSIEHVLGYFKYEHLPERLQNISKPYAELAVRVADSAPDSPETTIALRKLLESKDAAVRAAL